MDLLAQMRTFTRVVDTGSLSGAARAVRLSHAAVSRQISALEADLGVTLLLRTTRRLAVTEAGRRYYEHCLRVLREIEDGRASVARDRSVRGTLTVTAPVTYGLVRVAPSMAELLAKHPGLTVDLLLEDRVVDLVTEGVDVAIRTGVAPPDSASVVAHPLTSYERLLVASPAYLKERGIPKTPEALVSHRALVHLPGDGRVASWRFVRDGTEHVAEPRASMRTNAVLALRGAALDGLGIALLPDWLVEGDVAAGGLRQLLRDYRTSPVVVYALYRTELRGTPRILALIEHLKAHVPRTTTSRA
jgi:DNA-binding transcriptional LysR family regulator